MHDPIRRAQNHTALRGLVARRAIMLEGTFERPRLTFLEPHATLLGAFLGAEAVATIRREERSTARAVTLFAHRDMVVEQGARDGLAIQRMTAHSRDLAGELLRRELRLAVVAADLASRGDVGATVAGADPAAEPEQVELTARMMSQTIEAVRRREEPPSCVPARAADILYARRSSGSVTITARDRSGTRSAEKWSWVDAGELGFWRVVPDGDGPILRLVGARAEPLGAEIEAAWAAVAQAAPSP